MASRGQKDGYPKRGADASRQIAEAADSLAKASTPEPFSTSKTSNWVARGGGLPAYIQHIAHAVVKKGKSESHAIAIAIATVKRWAAGTGDVDAGTKAAASKALAEWEGLKAKNKVKGAAKDLKEAGDAPLSEAERAMCEAILSTRHERLLSASLMLSGPPTGKANALEAAKALLEGGDRRTSFKLGGKSADPAEQREALEAVRAERLELKALLETVAAPKKRKPATGKDSKKPEKDASPNTAKQDSVSGGKVRPSRDGSAAKGAARADQAKGKSKAKSAKPKREVPPPRKPIFEDLQPGAGSALVRYMQDRLNSLGYDTVGDGVYGRKTLKAVRRFQLTSGLKADGIVGPLTTKALRAGGSLVQPDGSPSENGEAQQNAGQQGSDSRPDPTTGRDDAANPSAGKPTGDGREARDKSTKQPGKGSALTVKMPDGTSIKVSGSGGESPASTKGGGGAMQESIFAIRGKWNPGLHPRNRLGRFREIVRAMKPGSTLDIGHNVQVHRASASDHAVDAVGKKGDSIAPDRVPEFRIDVAGNDVNYAHSPDSAAAQALDEWSAINASNQAAEDRKKRRGKWAKIASAVGGTAGAVGFADDILQLFAADTEALNREWQARVQAQLEEQGASAPVARIAAERLLREALEEATTYARLSNNSNNTASATPSDVTITGNTFAGGGVVPGSAAKPTIIEAHGQETIFDPENNPWSYKPVSEATEELEEVSLRGALHALSPAEFRQRKDAARVSAMKRGKMGKLYGPVDRGGFGSEYHPHIGDKIQYDHPTHGRRKGKVVGYHEGKGEYLVQHREGVHRKLMSVPRHSIVANVKPGIGDWTPDATETLPRTPLGSSKHMRKRLAKVGLAEATFAELREAFEAEGLSPGDAARRARAVQEGLGRHVAKALGGADGLEAWRDLAHHLSPAERRQRKDAAKASADKRRGKGKARDFSLDHATRAGGGSFAKGDPRKRKLTPWDEGKEANRDSIKDDYREAERRGDKGEMAKQMRTLKALDGQQSPGDPRKKEPRTITPGEFADAQNKHEEKYRDVIARNRSKPMTDEQRAAMRAERGRSDLRGQESPGDPRKGYYEGKGPDDRAHIRPNAKSAKTAAAVRVGSAEHMREVGRVLKQQGVKKATGEQYRRASDEALRRRSNREGKPPKPGAKPTTASDYLDERVNYGGIPTKRGDIIKDLQGKGHSQALIDRYLQGIDTGAKARTQQRNVERYGKPDPFQELSPAERAKRQRVLNKKGENLKRRKK